MLGRFLTPKPSKDEATRGFDSFDLRLGDVMRGERATLGKSLLDVQRELKIKASYVAAIENTDPTAFETPGFIAGYVRSYARYLGLDPEWAFDSFCREGEYTTAHGMSSEASSAAAVQMTRTTTRKKSKHSDPLADPNAAFAPKAEAAFAGFEPGAIGSMLVLVALIGGLGYGGWSVLQEVQRVQFAPVEQTPGVTATLADPLATPVEDTIVAAATTDGASGFSPATPDVLDRLYRPAALEVPVMEARDGPIASLNPQNVGALQPDNMAPHTGGSGTIMAGLDANAANPLSDMPFIQVNEEGVSEVAIIAVRPSWVRIKAADGSVVFEKVMNAGEMYSLPATEEAPQLRTGYAGAIYFVVNGKTYGPAGEGASVVSKVALGQSDIEQKFAVADLTQNEELASVVAALSVEQTGAASE